MLNILLVALGGALGSVARYLTGLVALRFFGPTFPWGTLGVNIVGSFAIGLLAELMIRRSGGAIELRLLLATGFLGGFTTFSAFALDSVAMFERGDMLATSLYIGASVMISLAATFAGLVLMRQYL